MGRLLRCAALVASLASCRGGGGEAEARWYLVMDALDGALFSVTGTAADDVWIAGADQGDGLGPTVLHWDGSSWERLDTGIEDGDLLWAHAFEGGPRYFAGSDGVILRHQDDGGLERMDTPSDQIVWGVWGSSPDDMWAVGGQTDSGHGFVWRDQGDGWEPVDLAGLPTPPAWFKVWGTAADDVWLCGMEGALMHWDGSSLTEVDSGTNRSLLTVHGRADGSLVTAVGGAFSATLVASEDGGPWHDVTPPGTPPLQTFGVYHRGDVGYAVGIQSIVLRHDGEAWHPADHDLEVYGDLHSVWIDPDGGVWSAGGVVQTPPYLLGTLIYRGTDPPATWSP